MLKNKRVNNIISAVFIVLSVVGLVIIGAAIRTEDIWYDEVFSVVFADRSYKDIIALTAADVHPPLYYFYLKAFAVLGRLLFPKISSIIFYKAASVFPLIILYIVSLTLIRRRFGILISSFFIFLMTFMPNLPQYYVEIRMYSFALMLVSVAFILAIEIVFNSPDKSNIAAYIILTITGVMTCYTQYFACCAIIGLYLCLFIYFIVAHRKKDIIKICICAAVSLLCFIPWIPILLKQIGALSGGYWIQPLTFKSIFGCIKYIFLPSIGIGNKGYVIAGSMILITVIAIIVFIMKKPEKEEWFCGFAGIVSIALMLLVGYIMTFIGRPIFVYRYMLPAFGMLYLGIAFMMFKAGNVRSIIIYAAFIIYIIGAYYTISSFRYEENVKISKMPEARAALEMINDNDVIIANFDQVCTLMDYYLGPDNIYLYDDETDPIVNKMFDVDAHMLPASDIESLVANNDNVYFFGSFNSREDLLAEWKDIGIDNIEVFDSCLIERYYFNIYKLSK